MPSGTCFVAAGLTEVRVSALVVGEGGPAAGWRSHGRDFFTEYLLATGGGLA
jgi:hypothetical protein